ncbi:hypothetical protein Hanom_Chr06g00523391 [Helianthus anomalus]
MIGEKVHGEDEGLVSGNEEMNPTGGAAQQSFEVNKETLPREQEGVGCQVNNGCFNFAAHSNCGPDKVNRGPSFVDHWANLVGQSSPRPRKRPRGNDSGHLVDLSNIREVPGSENNKGNKEFNLNISPRGSGLEQDISSGALEDGEIGEGN